MKLSHLMIVHFLFDVKLNFVDGILTNVKINNT